MVSPVTTCRVIFSGGFCCGKTTLIKMLAEQYGIPKIIDDSTRDMRPGEEPHFPYNFISEDEFQRRLDTGYYFESVVFNGRRYGIPKASLLKEKWSVDLLSTSWKLYMNIPGVIGIYLEPPKDLEILKQRARARGDAEHKIMERIESLKQEDPSEFIHRIPPQNSIQETYAIVLKILFGHIENGNYATATADPLAN